MRLPLRPCLRPTPALPTSQNPPVENTNGHLPTQFFLTGDTHRLSRKTLDFRRDHLGIDRRIDEYDMFLAIDATATHRPREEQRLVRSEGR